MQFSDHHRACLNEILTWRRDVRHFLPDPVSEDLLEQLEAKMDLAPSVGNARPWRAIRVENPELRDQVRQDFIACNANAAEIYVGEQKRLYLDLKLAGLDIAPIQLAVFTDTSPKEGHGLGRQTCAQTLQQSTAMAIYTLWLSARAANLGVGMVSILNPSKIEKIFSVPSNWVFSAYLCIGWPEANDNKPLLHKAGWQENTQTKWLRR